MLKVYREFKSVPILFQYEQQYQWDFSSLVSLKSTLAWGWLPNKCKINGGMKSAQCFPLKHIENIRALWCTSICILFVRRVLLGLYLFIARISKISSNPSTNLLICQGIIWEERERERERERQTDRQRDRDRDRDRDRQEQWRELRLSVCQWSWTVGLYVLSNAIMFVFSYKRFFFPLILFDVYIY